MTGVSVCSGRRMGNRVRASRGRRTRKHRLCGIHSGLMRVRIITPAAATSGRPLAPVRCAPSTVAAALHEPDVSGATRRTIIFPRRLAKPIPQVVGRQIHAQGGPKVATALAIAPGTTPTLQPMKLISRIMFGPRDRLREGKESGKLLVCYPTLAGDHEVAEVPAGRGDTRQS